jgi:hypothetical protein
MIQINNSEALLAHNYDGRKKGSQNRGHWFRRERGWYARVTPLRDSNGQHIKDVASRQAAEFGGHSNELWRLVVRCG